MLTSAYFALFFVSGIAGLIYESIWSHYLKLFLGHAAYAQTMVLVIYMGGMAIGSWIAGLRLKNMKNLLLVYAVVEFILGIMAVIFHDLFITYINISYNTVIPLLNIPFLIVGYKWITASLIILPQSVLLGTTFPLMAAGFIRKFPGTSGYKISFLYFTNTLGASLGVLLSGFFLIDRIGLKGAIITAGILDIVVGITVFLLCYKDKLSVINLSSAEKPVSRPSGINSHKYYLPLLLVSAGTASASFMYEIGWIRMLSLVLGSSTHSFELMLSAFIFGMALGSFFIRKKIDNIRNIPMAIVLAQLIMGICALLTIFTYNSTFNFMKFIMEALAKNSQGYILFNLSSHFICLLIMLPSTICAGMVLPLIVHMFYKDGFGEESIGKVYAVNTFGSIAGVIIATWFLMPVFGLRLLIIIGGIIDISIGLFVLHSFKETQEHKFKPYLPAISYCFIIFTVIFGSIDPLLTASGVFRNGTITKNKRIISNKDGKTATVTLFRTGESLVLTTNGKPDASVNTRGGISGDEYTMALTAVLPMAAKQNLNSAAVIGMGSGMTAHYLLYDTTVREVDVVEIEPAMVEAARHIGKKVSNTFTDNRCKIYIDDAKTFFSAHNRKYDIIISEPSNPWVSGVSGLFSQEYFSLIKNHLNKDGILVQWFHKYESDISILVSIFKALRQHFPNYVMYTAGSDLITIATTDINTDLSLKRDVFQIKNLSDNLNLMHFRSSDDFKAIKFASQNLFNQLIDSYDYPANSDYSPFVDLYAVKFRFIDKNIRLIDTIRTNMVPIRKIIESDTDFISFVQRDSMPEIYNLDDFRNAKFVYNELLSIIDTNNNSLISNQSDAIITLDYISINPGKMTFEQIFPSIIVILEQTIPYLSISESKDIWDLITLKMSSMNLSQNDSLWMNYFRSLCYYDMTSLYQLSVQLLPENGPITDDYVNRLLMNSLTISAYKKGLSTDIKNYWNRFEEKNKPDIMSRISMQLIHAH